MCADELLFYTSRYATYATKRLAELYEGRGVAAADAQARDFHACDMTREQRACMAQLLSLPPDPDTARAIHELTGAVANGATRIPGTVRETAGRCRARPYLRLTPNRPRHSTGLADTHPTEVLRHLGRRYGFPVRIYGRHVWLDDARCRRLLTSGPAKQARNVKEVLRALQRLSYRIHLDHPAGRRDAAPGEANYTHARG